MLIRDRDSADEAAVSAFLAERGSLAVARLGELERALRHPALLAVEPVDHTDPGGGGAPLGVLTYVPGGESWEILTLHAARPHRGVGSALIAALTRAAAAAGAGGLWLVTTNDNVDALRFYQRRGFRLHALHPGAVDRSRATLKPEIPSLGAHGIPLRDELVLRRTIEPAPPN